MIATQAGRPTERVVAKKIRTLLADSMDEILPCKCENVRPGVFYVVHKFIEQILFGLLRKDVMDEILDKHITKCFDRCDTADKVGGKLLSIHKCLRSTNLLLHTT